MTRTSSHSKADPERLRAFAVEAARLLADRKCTEVVLLDVRGHSQVCDYVAIGTGTSQRQMRSVAQELEELGPDFGMSIYRSSRDDGTTWIVADFVDLVVHLFEPDQRLYYDLELLWSSAAQVPWRRTSDGSRDASNSPTAPSAPQGRPGSTDRRGARDEA